MACLFVSFSTLLTGTDEPIKTNVASRKSYNQHYAAFILNTHDETDSVIESGFIVQLATKFVAET